MNQDYYTELRQLTDMICRKYSADPNVEAAMVTGSVSLGQVDAVSDVDMMLYYRELPSAEIFESIKEEALASGGGIYGYDPDAVGNILTVLSGLNGMIPPGKIKGLALRLDKMAHKPANLAERVQQLWLLPPQEMVPHFYAIVDDLLALVEARTPHISTQPVRERLQLRLEQR